MTEHEYRSHPAISSSQLWHIAKSPAHFRYEIDHPTPPTPAMAFGIAVHMAILQPDLFAKSYAVMPNINLRTKDGKAMKAELEKDGKLWLTVDEMAAIEGMKASVEANKYAMRLLDGPRETPHFWTDDYSGVACKCRTDAETDVQDTHIITDLKTCQNANTLDFQRDCIKYGYDFRAAMYREGVIADTGRPCKFVFIAVEKAPPYEHNVMQADELFLQRGIDLYHQLIGKYKDCRDSGHWYSYNGPDGALNDLGLPPWLAKDYLE